MSVTPKVAGPSLVEHRTIQPLASPRFVAPCGLIAAAALSLFAANLPAQGLQYLIPKHQQPLLTVLPPSAAQRSKPGDGKFVLFTREQVGKDWDFIAGAWECLPSRPEVPITKRVEFCHSSWNCTPLLDGNSAGMHPRFARLQVDSDDRDLGYTMNLYDINFRTWDVRCIWQGGWLAAFGVLGDSIFCKSAEGWLLIDAVSGMHSREIPFVPVETDGDFWLVRKPGETAGCWSYDRKQRRYVAHFGHVDPPIKGFSRSRLSPDGKCRAWVLASVHDGWRGGTIAGRLILQRQGEEDVSVPIEFQAVAGSLIEVIPKGIQLAFSPEGKLTFRAWAEDDVAQDRVWTIDLSTGQVSSTAAPHSEPAEEIEDNLSGVPVPDYLREGVKAFRHFGRSGLAPAFLLHVGILQQKPGYADCTAGVSPDGRHLLYQAHKGPLAGVLIYGDTVTEQTVQWKWPDELARCNAMDFVWVETPTDAEQAAPPDRGGD